MSSIKKGKSKKLKVDVHGKVFIQATFNNIIMTITNGNGDVVAWSSAGKMGFRGSKKNTPFAAQMTAEDCGKKVLEAGMAKLDVFIKGPGSGRDAAIRALGTIGFDVQSITDITPLPHNGCRPPKKRRV